MADNNLNANNNGESLKAIIQGMMPTGAEIMQGTVISASPLKIQMINDEKLIINERIAIVPNHLTEYTTEATLTIGSGDIDSISVSGGSHTHDGGTHEGHLSGDGSHSHSGGSHTHKLSTFTITKGTLTVHNALKVGETVYVLAINNGKLYYILDRVVKQDG